MSGGLCRADQSSCLQHRIVDHMLHVRIEIRVSAGSERPLREGTGRRVMKVHPIRRHGSLLRELARFHEARINHAWMHREEAKGLQGKNKYRERDIDASGLR